MNTGAPTNATFSLGRVLLGPDFMVSQTSSRESVKFDLTRQEEGKIRDLMLDLPDIARISWSIIQAFHWARENPP